MKSFILLVLCLICNFVCADQEILGKAQNVNIERISDSSSQITWEALFGSKWDDDIVYTVEIKSPNSSRIEYYIHHSDCTNLRCTLTNITANGVFVVDVQAFANFKYPEHGSCNAISSEEIRVSWESPRQKQIRDFVKGYKVTYAPSHRFYTEDKKDHIITSTNELVLQGLKKNTNYSINVLTTTTGGFGLRSITFNCSTEEDVPDEPVDVKVVVLGRDRALMLWKKPLEAHGEILYYNIYYRKKGSEANTEEVLATNTTYFISGLEAYVLYDFWVTASTKVGEGVPSKYVTDTLNDDTPAKITLLNKTITVKFNEDYVRLPCDAVGWPPLDVTWKVNGDNLKSNGRFSISYRTLYIKNITREDANNYTCIVTNTFSSDSITYELIVQAPPKAPEITVLFTTRDEITLQLKPNRTDSAPIHGFKLFHKLDSQIKRYEEVNVDSNYTQSYIIADCKCGSSYLFFAHGYNDLGDGEASEILTVRTNGSKPIAPAMADFLQPSADTVTLHFSSWNANSCPISRFFVEYKEKSNIDWVKIRKRLRPNTDFVLNLEAATWYDIRVTAHNSAGSTAVDYEVETQIEPDYGVATLIENAETIAPPSN